MNILVLTSRFPDPPDRGDRVRMFNFLRVLATKHRVRLLSFISDPEEANRAPALRDIGVQAETVYLSRNASLVEFAKAAPNRAVPFQVAYYESLRMHRAVREASADADVVLAHMIRMFPYLVDLPPSARRIVDLCDCISSEYRASLPHRRGIQKLFFREEAQRVAKYERRVIDEVDEAWFISPAEVEKVYGSRKSPAHVAVVPMGVSVPQPQERRRRGEAPPRILMTGNFSVPHNIDAAQVLVHRILPLLHERDSRIEVHLAGASPAPAVIALAGSQVIVHGFVPRMDEFLRSGDVFVAPMRFVAGVQTKILEALSSGIPVVTTPLVNRGLGGIPGTHLLLASDPTEFADQTLRLLSDISLAGELAREGRKFVQSKFRWENVLDRFERPIEKRV